MGPPPRADGPFIAIPVLTAVFPQGLDTVPGDILGKLRLAWGEVSEAPDLLTPGWVELVLGDLLGYTPQVLAEGGALPDDLRAGPPGGGLLRPDAIADGPDGQGGRAERLLISPAARRRAAEQGEPGPGVSRRAGGRVVQAPGHVAGAGHQREPVGAGVRQDRRACHDGGVRRRPVAGRT